MAGRPKLDLDLAKIEQYAMLGLSRRVIAALLECCEKTLRERDDASKAYLAGRAKRLAQIAKSQWDSLKKGNVTMAIWLGKNELGQSDQPPDDADAQPELESKVG